MKSMEILKEKTMIVPHFMFSVVLLLLLLPLPCQHGYGFRFRSTAKDYMSNGPASEETDNCSSVVDGLHCTEAYALVDVMDQLELPAPSSSFCFDNNSNDKSMSATCNCNETTGVCHITSLVTYSFKLGGNISERLGELIFLEEIDFSRNQLLGSIPKSLGKLARLKNLYLGYNQLSGPIPPTLGNLLALETLILAYNFLTGPIPPTLGNLKNLDYLSLGPNMLSGGIPKELGNLPNLTVLSLGPNRLSGGIPKELGNLSSLTYLDLGENQLNGSLPPELGNLNTLERLYLYSNNFTGGLPGSFAKLTSLRAFVIAGNNMSGRIPTFISNWRNLSSLNLVGNDFRGEPPPKIFDMSSLEILRISDLNNKGFSFPKFANLTNIETLVLRNCSLTGEIPEYIGKNWTWLSYLDLSFNNLSGSIPASMENLDLSTLLLTNNNLSGPIPPKIYYTSKVDLSYNNFTKLSDHDSAKKGTQGPGKQNITEPNRDSILALGNQCKSKHYSLYINCGGAQKTVEGNRYDEDNATTNFHINPTGKWAYSCSGDFWSKNANSSDYIKNMTCGFTDPVDSLSETARLCPLALTYYGFCLHKGNYTVELHFDEIVYTKQEDYSILGTRIFDVYIQRKRELRDFNIKQGSNITLNAIVEEDDPLEILFFWAGKGSYVLPPALNGPLVSAIAVTPKFKIHDRKLSPSQIAGIAVGCAFAPLLLFAFIWKMGWLSNKELREKMIEVQQRSFTIQQIVDATRNFSSKNEIGSGRFGVVYKAELPYQIKLAVKKISPQLKQQGKEEIKSEIGNLISLRHDNLVQLLGGYSNKDLHLLVYEYMEHGSLHQALFEPNGRSSATELNWRARFDICLGIAKGLKCLHEEEEKEMKIKIVHGNIKASNILLDRTHKAKLSDFGLAKIYDEEDPFMAIKARGNRVYMAPEYALGKAITVKADVYSYGVVVLEIVSGRSNAEYKANQEADFLLDTAGRLHEEGRILALVDKMLGSRFDNKQALTVLNLAMKCLNQSPTLRPSMSDVVTILSDIIEQDSKVNPSSSSSEIV